MRCCGAMDALQLAARHKVATQSKADIVSMRLEDGEKLEIEGNNLDVIYTAGHTDDSYSSAVPDRVFTGDTLLIRGTGRTDFQNGDARVQHESIFNRLLKLPDATPSPSRPTVGLAQVEVA